MKKIVFATSNYNKFNEIKYILPKNIKLISLKDLDFNEQIEESGNTLKDNAKIKSNYIYNKYSLSCFSDDSGLLIDNLNGEPGVYSSTYAGVTRNDLEHGTYYSLSGKHMVQYINHSTNIGLSLEENNSDISIFYNFDKDQRESKILKIPRELQKNKDDFF